MKTMDIHTVEAIKTLISLMSGQVLSLIYFRLGQVQPPNELRKNIGFQILDGGNSRKEL